VTNFENKLPLDPPAASIVADVPCELMQLTLADGYRTAARFFQPPELRTAAVYLHGIQSHSGWFMLSCDYLRRQGVAVLAPDRRGSGLNTQDRGHADHADQLMDDLDRAVDWLIQRTGQTRVHLVAVSWSGKLALAYAARFSDKIRSIALVAPGLCARIDITLTEKIVVAAHGAIHPHKLHPIPLDDPHLFTENPLRLNFIATDPCKLSHATAAFLLASRRLDGFARKAIPHIHLPVFLFLAELDRIIDNSATIALLKPILTPIAPGRPIATLYPAAHHTLDFESHPDQFFRDLTDALISENR
jgi:acylglycerol lipase